MKTTLIQTLLLVSTLGLPAMASERVAPALVAEVWTCSYKTGMGVADLLKARDFLVSKANAASLKLPTAFLWNLVKGDAGMSHVWFNVHPNMAAYGVSADALASSGIEAQVSSRFASVSDCVAGMGAARMISQRGEVPKAPVFIAAKSCHYVNGAGAEQLDDLLINLSDVMNGMGDKAPAFLTALMPFTLRASGAPDVVLYSGHENASAWSHYVTELSNTDAGERFNKHIESTLNCGDLSIWSSQGVVGTTQ